MFRIPLPLAHRRFGVTVAALIVLGGVACAGDSAASTAVTPPVLPPTTPTPSPATAPNVIVILAEALGWSGTSVQLDAAVPTSLPRYLCHPTYCAGYEVAARMHSSATTSLQNTGFRCAADRPRALSSRSNP